MTLKKLLPIAILVVAAFFGYEHLGAPDARPPIRSEPTQRQGDRQPAHTKSGQIQGSGVVVKVLADDNDGSRHQRFIVRRETGSTLLIVHNIDVAPRIDALRAGDPVEFHGELEWNPRGGVVHWTHRDPAGRHVGGWIRHNGRTYQ